MVRESFPSGAPGNLPTHAGDTRDTGIMAESCWCLVETTQCCKAIILQLTVNSFSKKERHEFDRLGQEEPLEEGMATHFSVFDWASLVAQMVKNLSTMQETWVQSLGWEDPVEKGIGRQRDRERERRESCLLYFASGKLWIACFYTSKQRLLTSWLHEMCSIFHPSLFFFNQISTSSSLIPSNFNVFVLT